MLHIVLGFSWLLLAGWFCTRSPLWLAKFIDRNVIGNTDISYFFPPTREFFVYIRQQPESWHLRYPRVLLAIRAYGWLAFTMLAVGILMMFLASIGIAKVGN